VVAHKPDPTILLENISKEAFTNLLRLPNLHTSKTVFKMNGTSTLS